jgi:hypothetical protein
MWQGSTFLPYNSVLDALLTLSESSGLGFTVDFDPETATETLRVYKGVDRSLDTGEDYVGYFSTSVGNAYQNELTTAATDFKNVAVVAGEGEGANRAVKIISIGVVTGENRRELYVDARDLQREYQVATFTGNYDEKGNPIYDYETKTYTADQYDAMLEARGYEKLAERVQTFGISCEIDQSSMRFNVDYFLDDRIPVKLLEYGVSASAVVALALRIYESGAGDKVRVTLTQFRLEETYG